MQAQFQVVDLFSGCGGLALGAKAAGFGHELAFDVDPILTSSFGHNFPGSRLVHADLSNVSGKDILALAGKKVLGVIGGPPCQGFSSIGYRDPRDPRRLLLGHFFRLVAEIRPAFFLMENVKGLGYESSRSVLQDALSLVPAHYTVVGPLTLDAADFGAATRRQRMFVLGYDASECDSVTMQEIDGLKCSASTVADAIEDLSQADQTLDVDGFDVWRVRQPQDIPPYRRGLLTADGTVTGHRKTKHSASVTARFLSVPPGSVDPVGRHPKLDWAGQCPTLRAGTGRDRGSFQSVRPIHPSDPRVITVREAARLQGFPDSFRFHSTVWHSFRMIGNSVSPIIAKSLLSLIASKVGRSVSELAAE